YSAQPPARLRFLRTGLDEITARAKRRGARRRMHDPRDHELAVLRDGDGRRSEHVAGRGAERTLREVDDEERRVHWRRRALREVRARDVEASDAGEKRRIGQRRLRGVGEDDLEGLE